MKIFKLALCASAALMLTAGAAMAGPPPWAGGPGGNPGNPANDTGGFQNWSSGEAFSGSGNEFGFSNSFEDAGATFGAFAVGGTNTGSATSGIEFTGTSFDSYATSENFGGLVGGDFGAGIGVNHRMDFDASSYGQSFGQTEWDMDAWGNW